MAIYAGYAYWVRQVEFKNNYFKNQDKKWKNNHV